MLCMKTVNAISICTSDFKTTEEKYFLRIHTVASTSNESNDALVFAKKHNERTTTIKIIKIYQNIKIIKRQGIPSQPQEPNSCLWHSHSLCSLRPRSQRQAIHLNHLLAEAFAASTVKCQIMDVHRLSDLSLSLDFLGTSQFLVCEFYRLSSNLSPYYIPHRSLIRTCTRYFETATQES